MDKLDCIELFINVARLNSFTAVANELNMTQGAVSKKIAWLEQRLGFSLFHRTSRKVTLTESGKAYLQYSLAMTETMRNTEQRLKNELSEVIGELKISAPSAFAVKRLSKPIAEFIKRHPKVKFNLSISDKQVDLYQDNIDIAIRAAYLKDSTLKAKKLQEHQLCYFASPTYLAEYGEPKDGQALSKHHCITYSLSNPANVWQLNSKKYAVNPVSSSDNPEMIVELARAGIGIAAMPKWMIEKDLDSGVLQEIFTDAKKYSLPMYLLYKNEEHLPYRIRAFIDFLSAYFGDQTNNR